MTSRHQFHLRWSNYGQNLANSFIRLFESESLSDVTLFCEGESYRAHRVVLAASSVHFQELFEQCSTAQNLVVILDGTTAPNLRALLEFMYKGEVYIDDANLNSFLQTAKRLQVKGLSLSQNDLHSISTDSGTTEERIISGNGDGGGARGGEGKLSSNFCSPPRAGSSGGGGSGSPQDTILAQALGPLLIPSQLHQQEQQQQQQRQQHHHLHQSSSGATQPLQQSKSGNSIQQSPPTSFSSPSPSQTPPHPHPIGYGEDKLRKKLRLTSPRHPSPNGAISDSVDYGGSTIPHPPRTSAPLPSPTMNPRHMDIDPRDRVGMHGGGFSGFGSHYPPVSQSMSHPPSTLHSQQIHGSPSHPSQQHPQQTIIMTENPNIRKIRSLSSENTMPEDLSIKLEVGRVEDLPGLPLSGKQRSFSMDLSPSEPPFAGLGVPGPPTVWSMPSPSLSAQQQIPQHHDLTLNINHAQSTADGKKLKCPFCERLYGYETNLRAHIRQRHQGIRVPCPFCTRTFTRNNTVRRHVAREHRALMNVPGAVIGPGIGQRNLAHPLPLPHPIDSGCPMPPFGSPPSVGSTGSSPKQSSPSTNVPSSALGSSPSSGSNQIGHGPGGNGNFNGGGGGNSQNMGGPNNGGNSSMMGPGGGGGGPPSSMSLNLSTNSGNGNGGGGGGGQGSGNGGGPQNSASSTIRGALSPPNNNNRPNSRGSQSGGKPSD